MKQILKEIEDGSFKEEWEQEKSNNYKSLYKNRESIKNSRIEKITMEMLTLLNRKYKK